MNRNDDIIHRALQLTAKTNAQLKSIVTDRDPANRRRFVHDKMTREAALRVLNVRRTHEVTEFGPCEACDEKRHLNVDGLCPRCSRLNFESSVA